MAIEIKSHGNVHFQWFYPTATVMAALKSVQEGLTLSAPKRRLCIKFLCSVDMYTNEELMGLFRVPEETIVSDLAAIVNDRNEVIGSVKPVDVVSQFIENQNYAIRKLRQTIELGSLTDKEKVMAIDKYSIANMRLVEVLQSLGSLPKELGNLAVTEEKWVACIAEGTGNTLLEKVTDPAITQGLFGNQIVEVEKDVENIQR